MFKNPVSSTTVEILRTTQTRRATTELALVDYHSGKKTYRLLVKRDVFATDDTGALRYGKSRGFNADDLLFLYANEEKILTAFRKGVVNAPIGGSGDERTVPGIEADPQRDVVADAHANEPPPNHNLQWDEVTQTWLPPTPAQDF